MSDIITRREKYTRGWVGGGRETPCGSGSTLANTAKQREWLPQMFEKYNIQSIADIGAGDLNWISQTKFQAQYFAYDLVPRHPDVIEFDLLVDEVPTVDAILCLWVLNHFPFDDCLLALQNLKASGSKYLIMTDRPIWHHEQPEEIQLPYLEELVLNEKGDRILLCELS